MSLIKSMVSRRSKMFQAGNGITSGGPKWLLLLLKSVGIDNDVALLSIVRSSRCVGTEMVA